ncbi:MAG: aldehyde oxidase and xanthine dehydrogenase a/b hammerhead, partial [Variovorax sp.]|nr:aldehyde oxidase and xanthine dehydrogenase a/b hammerhead [Variovorax sp.]
LDKAAYGWLVTSAIAKGRITRIDEAPARAVAGLLDIVTHENAGAIKGSKFFKDGGTASTTIVPLASPRIWHDGQIVALVVAETLEAAREAAHRLRIEYAAEAPSATFGSAGTTSASVAQTSEKHKDPAVGDAEAAFAAAPVRIDAEYGTPTQHHNPMELFTTSCTWSGDELTVHEPSQFVYGLKNGVAEQLGIDPAQVRVVSRYVGGAFGSRGAVTPRTAIVAFAAKRLGRPVKLVLTRQQGYTVPTYRAETRHRVRLGAGRDGRLTAYLHEGSEVTSRPDNYFVGGTSTTSRMYAFGSVATRVSTVHADRNTPGFMRSPPETPYMYALETAMDEMAAALAMDPVEFRRLNDTMTDPITGKPYSSRSLMQCYDEAARAFGWSRRSPQPGSMRDGDWLVGWGCATATYPTHLAPATARVRLTADGQARAQLAAHDIGTGTYTVCAQRVASRLGIDLAAVQVELGDTTLPAAPVSGGSNVTASTCSVLGKACDAIRARLFQAAVKDGVLAGQPPERLELKGGRIVAPDGASVKLADAFESLGAGMVEEYAEWLPPGKTAEDVRKLYKGSSGPTGGTEGEKLMFAFGAEFVEVRINARTREIRVPRLVGAFAAGHIMNPRTARSQLMGGMIWGLSSALHEATEIDEHLARYVNNDLAEYLVPVHADVAQLDVILVPEVDTFVNPAGVKGLGELGNVGTAAAVSSAVYHATGRRIRQLPIRLEDLL